MPKWNQWVSLIAEKRTIVQTIYFRIQFQQHANIIQHPFHFKRQPHYHRSFLFSSGLQTKQHIKSGKSFWNEKLKAKNIISKNIFVFFGLFLFGMQVESKIVTRKVVIRYNSISNWHLNMSKLVRTSSLIDLL